MSSTRSVVNKGPSSLSDFTPYTAVDGQVGSWAEDGRFFVTSPNSSVIYKPLFGPRDVYLRQDYLLGAEDPLLYPQPFLPDRCHWAAIPRRPLRPESARAKWWTFPPPEAFVNEPDSSVKGLGRWARDYVEQYEQDCANISERVSNYRSSQQSIAGINPVVTGLEGQLVRTLRHLMTMPLPFHRARQLWSFFRRWYLELVGALDWVELYKPVMDGQSSPSEDTKVNSAVAMGAFLTSIHDCEFFFKAGLPFWFVRPAHLHPMTRVDEQVTPIAPESAGICLDEIMSHKKEILYHGPLRDIKRAVAVEKFGLAIVDYSTDPFSVPVDGPSDSSSMTPSSSPTVLAPSPIKSPKAKVKQKRHEPYNKAKGKAKAPPTPQPERDKFSEIRGPYSPEIPDVWVEALALIDKSRRPTKEQVVNGGYAFPDPGMILYPPPEKMQRLLRNWLRMHPVLRIRHSMEPCMASSAWSPKQWRVLLGTTDDHASKEGSHMAIQRAAIRDLLGQCLDFYGLAIEDSNSEFFTWDGTRFSTDQLSDPCLVKQIVWELYELNFRFEFQALDRKCQGTMYITYGVGEASSFNPEIQACSADPILNPSQVSVDKANRGLAAAELRHRGSYFRQMCQIMKNWGPGGAAAESFLAGKEKLKHYTDDELVAMEQWATKFYCQTFYEKFGRPPILPHRLDSS
ncbi:hypothetical protein PQX77_012333 [Marasmius sp. AFHP31]|nr:hypothetical protein PQX77_012333 [Marasmius sp. AFHP31]